MSKTRWLFGVAAVLAIVAVVAAFWFGPAQTAGAATVDAIPAGGGGRPIWYGPQEWVTGEPTLSVSYPQFQHPDTAITSRTQTDQQWVYLSLPLPTKTKVSAVTVCYKLDEPTTFISQTRLTDMKTPDFATVVFDDATAQTSTTPTCYTLRTKVVTQNALVLQLRLNTKGDGIAAIHLGGVSILAQ